MEDPYDLVLAIFLNDGRRGHAGRRRTLSCGTAGFAENSFAAFRRRHIRDRGKGPLEDATVHWML